MIAHHILGNCSGGFCLRSSCFWAADTNRSEVKGCRKMEKKRCGRNLGKCCKDKFLLDTNTQKYVGDPNSEVVRIHPKKDNVCGIQFFKSKEIYGKVRKFWRQNFATKLRKS